MMTSNNFSSLKERHLQLSPWISKVGGYPGEYGEGPSSLEAFYSVHGPLAPSDVPPPEIWVGGGTPCLVR